VLWLLLLLLLLLLPLPPQVNTAARQLQLLYADMTEEVLSGRDYDDLLVNGHLLDVSDAAPAPQGVLVCSTGSKHFC
jgi:hypothetical protein